MSPFHLSMRNLVRLPPEHLLIAPLAEITDIESSPPSCNCPNRLSCQDSFWKVSAVTVMQAMAEALLHSGGPMRMPTWGDQADRRIMPQRVTDSGGRVPTGMERHRRELLHTTPWTGAPCMRWRFMLTALALHALHHANCFADASQKVAGLHRTQHTPGRPQRC